MAHVTRRKQIGTEMPDRQDSPAKNKFYYFFLQLKYYFPGNSPSFFPLNLFETSVLPTPPNPHSPLPMPFPGAQELLRGDRQNQDTNMQNYVFARGQLQGACATDARLLKTTVAFMTRNEKAARSS